jgi:protein-disulfide isomerase
VKSVVYISIVAISILGLLLSPTITSISADSQVILSPRQQMAAGVDADDVECREGLVLMIRSTNGMAACVKSTTSMKLSGVGWGAIIVDDEEDMMEDEMMEDEMNEMKKEESHEKKIELKEGLAMGEEDGSPVETPEEEPFTIGGVDLSMAAQVEGDIDAPLTIIEFGDYQCPNCKEWFQQQKSTITNNYISPGIAKLYFIDFTFLGDDSVSAAQGAYCAADQGKFKEYHSTLYNNQAGIQDGWASPNALKQFAKDNELDSAMFDECLDSGKYASRVSYNTDVGASLGITGTPHFFIVAPDGEIKEIPGPQPAAVFDMHITSMGYGP